MRRALTILAALALTVGAASCTSEGTTYNHRGALYGRARAWAAQEEEPERLAGENVQQTEIELAREYYETALGNQETELGRKIP